MPFRRRINCTPPIAPSVSSPVQTPGGSGTALPPPPLSIALVVRIAKVNPCQLSGVGTSQENVENVPVNLIVPWPSLPSSTSPGCCCSALGPPPQKPTPWLTMVNGESKSYVVGTLG